MDIFAKVTQEILSTGSTHLYPRLKAARQDTQILLEELKVLEEQQVSWLDAFARVRNHSTGETLGEQLQTTLEELGRCTKEAEELAQKHPLNSIWATMIAREYGVAGRFKMGVTSSGRLSFQEDPVG